MIKQSKQLTELRQVELLERSSLCHDDISIIYDGIVRLLDPDQETK